MNRDPILTALPIFTASMLGAAWSWSSRFDPAPDRTMRLLEWMGPLAFASCLVGAAVTGIIALASRGREGRPFGWAPLAALFAVSTISLGLQHRFIPATERLFYDEHTYIQIARDIAVSGRARVALRGEVAQGVFRCDEGSYPHWPAGWPTLLALSYRVFGFQRDAGWLLNQTLFWSAILLVAAAGALLGMKKWTAVAAAILFSCLPTNALWSRTGASEVLAAFTALLAICAVLIFIRRPGVWKGLFMTFSLASAGQVRNEGILILIVGLCVIILQGGKPALRSSRWPLSLAGILLLPEALHLGVISRNYDPSLGDGPTFSLSHLGPNLGSILQYLGYDIACALLLVISLAGLVLDPEKKRYALPAAWFLAALTPPALYAAGSYVIPGGSRFALSWAAPLALAAALALEAMLHRLSDCRFLPALLAVAILPLAILLSVSLSRRIDEENRLVSGDCAFLRRVVTKLPDDAMIITSDPPTVLAEGRSAVWSSWAGMSPEALEYLFLADPGRLYLIVSPTSDPEYWKGGKEHLNLIRRMSLLTILDEEQTSEGARTLFQLQENSPE